MQSSTVGALLKKAQVQLKQTLDLPHASCMFEAQILFEHVSGKNRAWQIAHSLDKASHLLAGEFSLVLNKRLTGMPIAFITGTQGFWSLQLEVSPCTLIPRQDTETLIEAALGLDLPTDAQVIDLGTGTGAIALALKKERSKWRVEGLDFVAEAVELARRNAQLNCLDVSFIQSNWLAELTNKDYDLIVSNPPYVESDSAYLMQGDLCFEPLTALASGKDGLDDIRIIIQQAYEKLTQGGFLLLEHGFEQAVGVGALMQQQGYVNIKTLQDYNKHDRLTQAQKPV